MSREVFDEASWLDSLGWTLIHSMWQLALIGLVFFLVRGWIRNGTQRRPASLAYLTGCFCMAAMVIAPIVTMVLLLKQGHNGDSKIANFYLTTPSLVSIDPASSTDDFGSKIVNQADASEIDPLIVDSRNLKHETSALASSRLPYVVFLWAAGVMLASLRPILGYWNVIRLSHSGLSSLSQPILELSQRLSGQMGQTIPIQFYQSDRVIVPTVIGMVRPMILLPASAITGLNPNQLEMIVAHEIAHVRRFDFLINFLQTMIESLLFYHPAVWLVSRQVRLEREICCDDWAVQHCGDALTYAKALLKLEQLQCPAALTLAANGGSLIQRISRLLGQPIPRKKYHSTQLFVPSISVVIVFLIMIALGNESVFGIAKTVTQSDSEPIAAVESNVEPPLSSSSTSSQSDNLIESVSQDLGSAGTFFETVDQDSFADINVKDLIAQQVDSLFESKQIRITENEIDQEIELQASRFGLSSDRFARMIIEKRNMSRDRFREMIRENLKWRKLVEPDITITQTDLMNAYESRFGPRVNALAIFSNDQRQAMKLWSLVKDDLTEEHFRSLASTYSVEPMTRQQSGQIESIRKNNGNQVLEDIAFELKPGEISGPIQVGKRWILLYCQGQTDPIEEDFDSVKEMLRDEILKEKIRVAIKNRFDQLEQDVNSLLKESDKKIRQLQSDLFRARATADRTVKANPKAALKILLESRDKISSSDLNDQLKKPLLSLLHRDIAEVVSCFGDLDLIPLIHSNNPEPLVARTYAVADLIAPVNATHQSASFDGTAWHDLTRSKGKADPEELIKLIQATIEPDSWSQEPGENAAVIQYLKPSLSLIILTRKSVHNQIADLLEKLRELTEVSIELRAFIAIGGPEEWTEHPVNLALRQDSSLTARQFRYLRSFAVAKDEIDQLEIPTTTLFNGQAAKLEIEHFEKISDLQIKIQAVVSASQKSVQATVNVARLDSEDVSMTETRDLESGKATVIDVSHYMMDRDTNIDDQDQERETLQKDIAQRAILVIKPVIFRERE